MKKFTMGSALIALALTLAACVSTPPNPLVGTWDINIDTPVGAMPAVLEVTEDLTGTMSSDEMGAASLENIMVEDNSVTFQTTVDAQGQTLVLDFDGVVAQDSLSGRFDSAFGAIDVTGERRP